MFGTVDGTGRLDIYNLNKSEFPISSQHAPSGPNATRPALNKLEWDVSGKFVAVGSVDEANCDAICRVHGERFAEIRPANTLVVAKLIGSQYLVEIEAEAVIS